MALPDAPPQAINIPPEDTPHKCAWGQQAPHVPRERHHHSAQFVPRDAGGFQGIVNRVKSRLEQRIGEQVAEFVLHLPGGVAGLPGHTRRALNPGYLSRMKARNLKEGRRYFIGP